MTIDPGSFVHLGDGAEFRKVAVTIPVSRQVPVDTGLIRNTIAVRMEDYMDRVVNPWRYPDRNPMPKLDWWPWIDRWRAAPGEARSRIDAAVDVLRNGVPDRDEDY